MQIFSEGEKKIIDYIPMTLSFTYIDIIAFLFFWVKCERSHLGAGGPYSRRRDLGLVVVLVSPNVRVVIEGEYYPAVAVLLKALDGVGVAVLLEVYGGDAVRAESGLPGASGALSERSRYVGDGSHGESVVGD